MLNQSGTKKRMMQRRRRTVALCSVVIPALLAIWLCSVVSSALVTLSLLSPWTPPNCTIYVLPSFYSFLYPIHILLTSFCALWLLLKCVFRSVNQCWLHVLWEGKVFLPPLANAALFVLSAQYVGCILVFAGGTSRSSVPFPFDCEGIFISSIIVTAT
jgi:hypothetical protein